MSTTSNGGYFWVRSDDFFFAQRWTWATWLVSSLSHYLKTHMCVIDQSHLHMCVYIQTNARSWGNILMCRFASMRVYVWRAGWTGRGGYGQVFQNYNQSMFNEFPCNIEHVYRVAEKLITEIKRFSLPAQMHNWVTGRQQQCPWV